MRRRRSPTRLRGGASGAVVRDRERADPAVVSLPPLTLVMSIRVGDGSGLSRSRAAA
ncbi:hypothetical protein IMZ11_34900 [Microtetraspora sp. AC03309]|uniref:hypothetical protein n=1 Tax=Microtetraspora sp. AC03309 TaxID=2779376 RepID=UPI001E5A3449|nr:hypothetical protein [Microtetraspora sp. AC03309]MCC5580819.1 hypothetical protein [Microtetraspora sp. AC03309]